METVIRKIFAQLLQSWFMADGGIGVWRASWGLGRILTVLTVDVIELFRLGVIGFEFVVSDGPGGRDAA